ncbi:MAG: hypothetical protein CFE26_06590 [Verrucomicrobiales bacterium VVV1]|nr:MAG: hypothetical protein CFE26_06590 [Verrucomicrobiales bacterium VVV1]
MADCCGLQAFDFSPIRIAAFIELQEVVSPVTDNLRVQLTLFKQECGAESGNGGGSISQGLFGRALTGSEVDSLVAELDYNLSRALDLKIESDAVRWRPIVPAD